MDTLVFGTDGWRDIIGERFTFDNVSRAAQAYADSLSAQGTPSALVGYDTRFNGSRFARRVAEVLAANGIASAFSRLYPYPGAVVCRQTLGCRGWGDADRVA